MTTATTGSSIVLDLSWAELGRILAVTATQIRAGGVPDAVLGVLRGGMAPAVMLAHRLGVRDVRGITTTRTAAEGPNAPTSTHPATADPAPLGDLTGRDVLLVDDVTTTGLIMTAAAARAADLRPGRLRQVVIVADTTNWAANDTGDDLFDRVDHVGTAYAGRVRFPWESR
ncbi:MAG: phosphoribosyltransferase [Pseudonocardia sp.]